MVYINSLICLIENILKVLHTSLYTYRINVHWYLTFSSCVIKSCVLDVYKLKIQICFPYRLMEGRGEGASFVVTLVIINLFIGFEAIISRFFCCVLKEVVSVVEDTLSPNFFSGFGCFLVQNNCWDKSCPKGH